MWEIMLQIIINFPWSLIRTINNENIDIIFFQMPIHLCNRVVMIIIILINKYYIFTFCGPNSLISTSTLSNVLFIFYQYQIIMIQCLFLKPTSRSISAAIINTNNLIKFFV